MCSQKPFQVQTTFARTLYNVCRRPAVYVCKVMLLICQYNPTFLLLIESHLWNEFSTVFESKGEGREIELVLRHDMRFLRTYSISVTKRMCWISVKEEENQFY